MSIDDIRERAKQVIASKMGISTEPDFEMRLRDFLMGDMLRCDLCGKSVDPRDHIFMAIPVMEPEDNKNWKAGHPECVKAWYNSQRPDLKYPEEEASG